MREFKRVGLRVKSTNRPCPILLPRVHNYTQPRSQAELTQKITLWIANQAWYDCIWACIWAWLGTGNKSSDFIDDFLGLFCRQGQRWSQHRSYLACSPSQRAAMDKQRDLPYPVGNQTNIPSGRSFSLEHESLGLFCHESEAMLLQQDKHTLLNNLNLPQLASQIINGQILILESIHGATLR